MVQARHDLGLTEREKTFTYKHKPNSEETIQDRYKYDVKNGWTCCL